jgi:hypothetical protein
MALRDIFCNSLHSRTGRSKLSEEKVTNSKQFEKDEQTSEGFNVLLSKELCPLNKENS